ncbi:LysR family transcriptional regulator [Novosphingobium flavum]|uniref:LysR family transcriptional regulator n=1 Tax=Novosphingobium aerophilum TaxID=2839843 RepID=A0A7X1KAT0_9SPHN|nr:LysR substrate-binding domain-containing protein [Novosphingobium aerophilum]MBC2650347.1 LysR family transcriptional regulator [Novosphingobium aerophilum]MBC2660308.1 LysR family transcriptional regulator [Novosphingobium aerophilum]
MDLRQLRYFSVLADTLNFHRAAERLGMSQPPLTVAIRRLEDELGAPLFERDSRGVRLTAAGLAALPAARAALAQADQVREAVRQGAAGLRGRLVIGFIGSAVGSLLPRIISPFRQALPLVELVLQEMNSVEIVRAIASRSVDVGLVRLPLMEASPVEIAVIERDELVAALPPHFEPVARGGRIPLGALAETPFILHTPVSVLNATVRLACQRAGFTPRVAQEAVQVQTILGLVQAGLGVALVPGRTSRSAPDGVRMVPLEEPIPIDMGIACRPDAGPLARNFIAMSLASDDTSTISQNSD